MDSRFWEPARLSGRYNHAMHAWQQFVLSLKPWHLIVFGLAGIVGFYFLGRSDLRKR